jgi:hypothetical protein
MYKTLIIVIALYGSETWNRTRADKEALDIFTRRVLRVIYELKSEEDNNRSRYIHELYQLFQDADIVTVLHVNRLGLAGHINRRPNYMNVLQIMVCFTKVDNPNFKDNPRIG